jgi:uncharacterized peroxidase-related enzyme
MAHITLQNEFPGIVGLMAQYPTTAAPLNLLAETLLRGPSTLPSTDRELIAAYTSHLNNCNFCHSSHAAASAAYVNNDYTIIDAVKQNVDTAPVSEKMKALLKIAAKVQKGGLNVNAEDIKLAKDNAATDDEIHSAVLIAAAFCMFNRYVDGLGTWSPQGREHYLQTGKMLAERGYVNSVPASS